MERLFLLLTFWSCSSLNPHLLQSCWAEPPRTTDCTAHLWVMNACICCCVNMKQGIHEKSMQAGLVYPLGENSDGVGVGCCSDVALSQSLWAVKGGWGHTRLRLMAQGGMIFDFVNQLVRSSGTQLLHPFIFVFLFYIMRVSLYKLAAFPPACLLHFTRHGVPSLSAPYETTVPGGSPALAPSASSDLCSLLCSSRHIWQRSTVTERMSRGTEDVMQRGETDGVVLRRGGIHFHFIYLRLTLVTSILYVFHSEKPTLIQSFGNCKLMWETHSRVELKQLVDGQKNENSF